MADPGEAGQNSLFWYVSYLLRTEGLVPVIAAVAIVRGFITRNRTVLFFSSFHVFY
jgi:hypothetical protein